MNRKLALQSLKKILLILPYITILSLSDIILATPQEQPLSTALWYGIFERVTERNIHMLILSMESLGYIFLFSLLFGTYLSGFFDSVSTFSSHGYPAGVLGCESGYFIYAAFPLSIRCFCLD